MKRIENYPCIRRAGVRVLLLLMATLMATAAAYAQPNARQMSLLANNCLQCHTRPETGAPLMGRAADWRQSVASGEEAMLINVVQGKGGMPPLGYCSACSEQDFRVLIRLMAALPTITTTTTAAGE